MKIKSITIKNFKAFDNITIDFTSNKNGSEKDIELDLVALTKDKKNVIPYIVVIMGRNSIGKSTLLDAIVFFTNFFKDKNKIEAKRQLIHKKMIREFHFRNSKNITSKDIQNNLEKDMEEGKYNKELFEIETNLYASEYKKNVRDNNKSIEILLEFDSIKKQNIKLSYPSLIHKEQIKYAPLIESIGNTIDKTNLKQLFINLEAWSKKVIIFSDENIIEFSNKHIGHYKLYSQDTQNTIELLIDKFKDTKKLKSLNELVRLANPKFIEFVKDEGVIRYAEEGSSMSLSLNSLSTGTKRFLQLIYYIKKLAENKSGILLIDEIENYLHSELVNVIKIGLINIASKYNVQVIFTTHNPLVLNKFISNKQIISLDDEDEKVTSSKVSSKMKPRNNIIRKYENGEIVVYPNPEHAKSISRKIFSKW